jgi:hypothetical protein
MRDALLAKEMDLVIPSIPHIWLWIGGAVALIIIIAATILVVALRRTSGR